MCFLDKMKHQALIQSWQTGFCPGQDGLLWDVVVLIWTVLSSVSGMEEWTMFLSRRLELLREVARLQETLDVPGERLPTPVRPLDTSTSTRYSTTRTHHSPLNMICFLMVISGQRMLKHLLSNWSFKKKNDTKKSHVIWRKKMPNVR